MSKIILITGSTDGIGKLAAIKLAKQGHQVCFHGRNPEKLQKVLKEAKEISGNELLKGFTGDLADLKVVKRMAVEIQQELPKIDILINNAGVFKSSQPKIRSGLDIRFVVNYLAPYLLTKDLLPLLQKSNEAKIINLSSAAQATISYPLMLGEATSSDPRDSYAQSKLALTMWSFELAKQLKNISVIPVNPGSLLNTRMVQEAYGRFWSPADKGANILYDLAVKDQYKNITGQYFDNDQGAFEKAHLDAYNPALIKTLLETTESILTNELK